MVSFERTGYYIRDIKPLYHSNIHDDPYFIISKFFSIRNTRKTVFHFDELF